MENQNAQVEELRIALPTSFNNLSHNSSKVWVAEKDEEIVKVIFMSDCPKGTDFNDFRNSSKYELSKLGNVKSGYVTYFQDLKSNFFCQLTDGNKTWY